MTNDLKSSSLRNSDKVLVKLGSKSKKLFKGIVELESESDKGKLQTHSYFISEKVATKISSKKPKLSPLIEKIRVKLLGRKRLPETKNCIHGRKDCQKQKVTYGTAQL